MSVNLASKALLGAVALAVAGAAAANTSADASTTGDLLLNVVNTSNSTSFLFDTGISQASFNGNGSYSIDISSDPNYTSFLAAAGTLDYSVVSATTNNANGTTSGNQYKDTVYITSTVTPANTAVAHGDEVQVASTLTNFLSVANTVASTTSNSVFLNSASNYYGAQGTEGVISVQAIGPAYVDNASLGTALAFYGENATNLTTFAGQWDLSTAGVLTYNAGSSSTVPLPAPVVLLLSGLGLMGVVARRRKQESV
jgi:hypothetical protein